MRRALEPFIVSLSRPVLQYSHCLLRLQGIILSVKISLHFSLPNFGSTCSSTLDVRGLSRAARASQAWRGLAKPMLDEFEVAYVMERMMDALESGWCWPGFRVSGPLVDSDDDGDESDWYNDGHDAGDLNGECIGCSAAGVAGGQCLSCGAPVEPWDGSFHYDFGWVDGPRAE